MPTKRTYKEIMEERERITYAYKRAFKDYYGYEPSLKCNAEKVAIESYIQVSFKTLSEMTEFLRNIKPILFAEWPKEDKIVHMAWILTQFQVLLGNETQYYPSIKPGEELILALKALKEQRDNLLDKKQALQHAIKNIID